MGTSGHVKVHTPEPGTGDPQRAGHCHLCPFPMSSWVQATVISLNSALSHHHTFVHAVTRSPSSLFRSSRPFKTCSSALTQHTKNRARSSLLSTQTAKHRQESPGAQALRSVCWLGSYSYHWPAVWPWASHLPPVNPSFLTTHPPHFAATGIN